MTRSLVAAATVALAGHAIAQSSSITRTCPNQSSGICYELNIPETTANSGSGDIYFAITAPTSYQWVALGQGMAMDHSNIFLVYTSADGQNVTVSPRAGAFHVEPEHDTQAQIELLAGSGVSNGQMRANIRCSNCNSWNGGTMDFSSGSASWIHAEKSGDAINSDSLTVEISQHDTEGVFDWSFASAKGGNDVNPFVTTSASTGNSGAGSGSGSQTVTTTGTTDDSEEPSNFDMIVTAHGTLASLAFILFFPTGGILVRLASFSGLVWVHAAVQAVGYVLFVAAFGMGVWMAITLGYTGEYHPIIGYILFAIVTIQPLGGLLHHIGFKKTGKRSVISHLHVWGGRIAVVVGIINGGLGLKLAGDASRTEKIVYGVFGGIMGLAFLAAAVFGELKKGKSQTSTPKHEMVSRDGSSHEQKD